MRLIDFKRVLKHFDIEKGSLSAVYMTDNVKRYELKFGGHKYSFVDDGKNNDVLLSRDIGDFEYLNNNNSSNKNSNKGVIAHLSTRKALLLSLLAASRNNSKKYVGSYEGISASIIGEILAEVNPFISYEGLLRVAGNGINYTDQDLRDKLESFAKAVNPFAGKSADMIDASIYPPSIEISGGSYKDKDEKIVGTWLDITDLNSKNSTRYTCSEAGFSYRLNYITPDKSERFEIIYNYSSQSRSEKVVIRKWIGKKTEKDVIRKGSKQDLSDYFKTEIKWEYLLDSELIYNITDGSLVRTETNPLTSKPEKTTYPYILPDDLQGIYGDLNQAATFANEITSPVLPKNTRGRY